MTEEEKQAELGENFRKVLNRHGYGFQDGVIKIAADAGRGQYSHRHPRASEPDEVDECLKIAGLMKHLAARVAAIDDVITNVAYRGAGGAGHSPIYLGQCR